MYTDTGRESRGLVGFDDALRSSGDDPAGTNGRVTNAASTEAKMFMKCWRNGVKFVTPIWRFRSDLAVSNEPAAT